MIFHSLFFANFDFPDRLCKGSPIAEPLQGLKLFFNAFPGFSLRSNPGLGLANAFGVFIGLASAFDVSWG